MQETSRKRQTRAEQFLWRAVEGQTAAKKLKFRRQVPVGYYIVDFVSFEKKIIIELDGGQHAETDGT